jgi:hypothetical protein
VFHRHRLRDDRDAAGGRRAVPDLTAAVTRLDAAFGFRWPHYARRVSTVPFADSILAFCYRNWIGGFVAGMAALAYVRDYRAIGEFTIAYVLTALAAVACFDVFALGSVTAFHLPGHHPSSCGPDYLRAFSTVRKG